MECCPATAITCECACMCVLSRSRVIKCPRRNERIPLETHAGQPYLNRAKLLMAGSSNDCQTDNLWCKHLRQGAAGKIGCADHTKHADQQCVTIASMCAAHGLSAHQLHPGHAFAWSHLTVNHADTGVMFQHQLCNVCIVLGLNEAVQRCLALCSHHASSGALLLLREQSRGQGRGQQGVSKRGVSRASGHGLAGVRGQSDEGQVGGEGGRRLSRAEEDRLFMASLISSVKQLRQKQQHRSVTTASTAVPRKTHARAASGIQCTVGRRSCRHTCLVLALMLAPCSRSS